jgi:hypothetical protein
MNQETMFLLRMARQLENEISILTEGDNFAINNYNHNDLIRKYRNNTKNYPELISQQRELIKDINKFVYNNCCHEWCSDELELNNEYIKHIKYCTHCHSTKKD